ncbi:4'-phosphopantetheinyl transferase superfamily protein [Rugamonas sp.]|uniref:4'-phosphopantetheinyl transferase superfamily protein n=1 Tax=Rugamonas sp. TaxID=1926287 RepID=UPI0025DF40CC|nr:4'-phosphopantetheinyl transferase superfamily protein [Rugamonas sp.]
MNWSGTQNPPAPDTAPGERLPVYLWPDAAPDAGGGAHDIFVLAVRTDEGRQRERARLQIREAVRVALSRVLDIDPAAIALPAAQGRAPRVVLNPAPARAGINATETAAATAAPSGIGISISHESGLSLAAVNLRGAIGVDLMRVHEVADWEVVARDYLGPDAARTLAAIPAGQRAKAFAAAWTAREAGLKCLGLALQEWQPAPLPCRQLELLLPDGYAGSVAIPF